ncbi:hypothetical protein BBJ28_00020476 [Nothophytophthora sp. Chile5]|nr:hypothetical protein BBJ28_00020476 [Nothophytophthora sp. Chile5]
MLLYIGIVNPPKERCDETVRAEFGPVRCQYHRPSDPVIGWSWITHEEARILTILRTNEWTKETLDEFIMRDHNQSIINITKGVDDAAISDEEDVFIVEESPRTPNESASSDEL